MFASSFINEDLSQEKNSILFEAIKLKRERHVHSVFTRDCHLCEKTPVSVIVSFVLQKTATAVAHCKGGNGLVKVNGRPLDLIEPEMLRSKVSLENLTHNESPVSTKNVNIQCMFISHEPSLTHEYHFEILIDPGTYSAAW